MAVCGGCGAQGVTRTKTILTDNRGELLKKPIEFCVECKPEEFDRWLDPSNKHGGFRWQYEPEKYIKRYREDGSVFYEATDERRADLEAKLAEPADGEAEAYARAVEKKRRNRRTTPMTKGEIESTVNRLRPEFEKADLQKKWLQ